MPITVTHHGIKLTLNEISNLWESELFSRGVESLAKAKERIDRHLGNQERKKKPPFAKFDVWANRYPFSHSNAYVRAAVTSITDDNCAWVSRGDARSKERYVRNLILCNAKNDALIAEIGKLERQRAELADKVDALEKKLERYKV